MSPERADKIIDGLNMINDTLLVIAQSLREMTTELMVAEVTDGCGSPDAWESPTGALPDLQCATGSGLSLHRAR